MLQSQLMGFYERVATDMRLTPFHISLYLALLRHWQESDFGSRIILNRRTILVQARIGSAHTLYRCLKELAAWGYIAYDASKSPSYGSSISIHTILPKKVGPKVPANTKTVEKQFAIPPNQPDVVLFFQEKGYPPIEAQKFFNHFQSNGWKVGGKAPMRNWHAAADNWILNSHNFKKEPVQQTLNLNTPKSYEEPL